MRYVRYCLAALLLSLSMVGAVSIEGVDAPSEPVNSSYRVSVTTDAPANISISNNASGTAVESENETQSFETNFSVSAGETNHSILAEARNGTNSSDYANQTATVSVDTIPPRISPGINESNVTVNESFTITAKVSDANLESVYAGNDDNYSSTDARMNSNMIWTLSTNASSLSCQTGANCTIRVTATDALGQSASNTELLSVSEAQSVSITSENESDNSSDNKTLDPITIVQPEDLVSDQSVAYEVEVNISGFEPASEFCEARLIRNDGAPLQYTENIASNADDDNTETREYDREAFSGDSLLTLEDGISLVRNTVVKNTDSLTLRFSCSSDNGSTYSSEQNFTLFDETNPIAREFELINVTNTYANISMNASEPIRVTSLQYNIPGQSPMNMSTTPGFDERHVFQLAGLDSDQTYVVRVRGEDLTENSLITSNEQIENKTYAQTRFTTTGNSTEENATSLEKQLLNQSNTSREEEGRETFSGANFSYARDWLEPGQETTRLIGNFDMNVRELVMKPRVKLRNVHGTVIESDDAPQWVGSPPNVSVAEYYKIDVSYSFIDGQESDDPLEYVKIRFQVENDWLDANGIDDVTLYRKHDGNWESLPTSKEEEGALLTTYRAVSHGFSFFAVGGEEEGQAGVQLSGDDDGPDREEQSGVESVEETEEESPAQDTSEGTGYSWLQWPLYVALFVLLAYGTFAFITRFDTRGREDPDVLKAHTERLETFVDKALAKGVGKDQLRSRLIDEGWDERLVNFVLRNR